MTTTLRATIREGRIETLEPVKFPDGARVVVTLQPDEGDAFWSQTNESSLRKIWGNSEDDAYAALLQE